MSKAARLAAECRERHLRFRYLHLLGVASSAAYALSRYGYVIMVHGAVFARNW